MVPCVSFAGDFNYDHLFDIATLSFNYDPSSGNAIDMDIQPFPNTSCHNCFIFFDVVAYFKLDIVGFKVHTYLSLNTEYSVMHAILF